MKFWLILQVFSVFLRNKIKKKWKTKDCNKHNVGLTLSHEKQSTQYIFICYMNDSKPIKFVCSPMLQLENKKKTD
jgi:hypothetical protein